MKPRWPGLATSTLVQAEKTSFAWLPYLLKFLFQDGMEKCVAIEQVHSSTVHRSSQQLTSAMDGLESAAGNRDGPQERANSGLVRPFFHVNPSTTVQT
jgi:hypothetical protein